LNKCANLNNLINGVKEVIWFCTLCDTVKALFWGYNWKDVG
jgi:hypothetical protein